MPRGDRTGPDGMGPMTGRGLGFCNGFASPGYGKMTPRGMGGRFGRGRGFGYYAAPYRGYAYPAYDAKTERNYLEDEIKLISEQLETLKSRLSELSKEE